MPKAVTVETTVGLIDRSDHFVVCANTWYHCTCRDGWIDALTKMLRDEVRKRPIYAQYDDVDMQLTVAELYPRMHGTCKVSVRLDGIANNDAIRIADEVANRYADCNPVGRHMFEFRYDPFMETNTIHMAFIGNEWSLAEAWWFILLIRLYADQPGKDVCDILEQSNAYDPDNWYDPGDKDNHIELWKDSVDVERNPVNWFIESLGPILLAYDDEVEE